MRQSTAVVSGELVIVALCVVGAVISWGNGMVRTSLGPDGDLPAFEATRYVGAWLLLAVVLVGVAGLLVIDIAGRLLASD
ncbi:hypothetical protein ACWEKT_32740 [Nocardia takedensis]